MVFHAFCIANSNILLIFVVQTNKLLTYLIPNAMKCIVDFWKIENALKDAAYECLKTTIEAHGGSFSWVDENGDFRTDICAPVVAANLDCGPTDMKIRSLTLDDGIIDCEAEDNEYGQVSDLAISDIVSAGQMQFLIEAIPEPEN